MSPHHAHGATTRFPGTAVGARTRPGGAHQWYVSRHGARGGLHRTTVRYRARGVTSAGRHPLALQQKGVTRRRACPVRRRGGAGRPADGVRGVARRPAAVVALARGVSSAGGHFRRAGTGVEGIPTGVRRMFSCRVLAIPQTSWERGFPDPPSPVGVPAGFPGLPGERRRLVRVPLRGLWARGRGKGVGRGCPTATASS